MTAAVDSRRLRRNFSDSAERYDQHARIQKQVVAGLLEFIRDRCPAEGIFLDVGCGTGGLARELTTRYPRLQPVLSDIAHGMTCCGRDRLTVALAVDATAEALPFASGSFDLVCSSSVYQWVLDLPGAFAESSRVLRNGGLFAFALFGRETLRELKTAYRQAARIQGSDLEHLHDLPLLGQVEQAMRGAGFAQLEVQRQELVEYHATVADLLRNLKQIGAGNASPDAPRGLASRSLLQTMTDIYRQHYQQDGNIPATYEVIYGRGVVEGR